MSKVNEILVIGGTPSADLLPPEIRKEHRGRKTRGKLLWGILGVVLLVFAGTGASYYFALTSQMALAAEQNRTNDLMLEQQKYSEVRVIQGQIATIQAGQRVGTGTEIDWKAYLDQLEGTFPEGAIAGTVTVESASPLIDYPQADIPFQGPRVATVSVQLTTSTIPDASAWVDALAKLPGFVDASPSSVMRGDAADSYDVSLIMHLNEDAWSQRFVPEEEKEAAEADDADEPAVPAQDGE